MVYGTDIPVDKVSSEWFRGQSFKILSRSVDVPLGAQQLGRLDDPETLRAPMSFPGGGPGINSSVG